jgi:dipeptidyl aminopeptidase/acylaminoacyl peptidase
MPDLDTRFRSFGRVRAPELWSEIERREPSLPPGPPLRPRIVAAVVALVVAAAGFAVALRALSGGPRAERPASPAVGDRIAFSAYRDGSWNIFSVNPDGTDLQPLTSMPTDEFAPAFSPDGSHIAFVVQRAGSSADADLYVMNVDGKGPTRLTSTGTNWDPTWSPDGTQIAFRKSVAGDEEIYVVGADGSGERDVSRSPQTWELAPSWSPDGTRIAFTSVRGNDQGPQVYVMNADGTGVKQLTDTADPHDSPQWSPDGDRIAFATQKNGVWGVDVMNADRSGIQRIAETPGRGASPSWSPDGSRIAYETGSVNADFADLNVVNADGSGAHAIARDEFPDLCCPTWGGTPPSPSPTASISMTARTPEPTHAQVSKAIPLGGPASVNSVAYGEGSVWASVAEDHGNSIVRIDPQTEEILAKIPVPVTPGWVVGGGGLTVADGRLWVAGDSNDGGEVVSIDPGTDQVDQQFHLHARVADVALIGSEVWVLEDKDGGPVLAPIDQRTGELGLELSLSGEYGRTLVALDGKLFAAVATGSPSIDGTTLYVVDPSARSVLDSFPFASYAPISSDGHGLYAAPQSIVRIQFQSGSIMSVSLDPAGATGDAVAAGEGHVWFFGAAAGRALGGYNTSTGRVDVTARVGGVAMAVSPGAVWVVDGEALTRVDVPSG